MKGGAATGGGSFEQLNTSDPKFTQRQSTPAAGPETMPELKEGWAHPLDMRQAHYFVDHQALCRGYLFCFGPVDPDKDYSPDNCPECKAALQNKRDLDKLLTIEPEDLPWDMKRADK